MPHLKTLLPAAALSLLLVAGAVPVAASAAPAAAPQIVHLDVGASATPAPTDPASTTRQVVRTWGLRTPVYSKPDPNSPEIGALESGAIYDAGLDVAYDQGNLDEQAFTEIAFDGRTGYVLASMVGPAPAVSGEHSGQSEESNTSNTGPQPTKTPGVIAKAKQKAESTKDKFVEKKDSIADGIKSVKPGFKLPDLGPIGTAAALLGAIVAAVLLWKLARKLLPRRKPKFPFPETTPSDPAQELTEGDAEAEEEVEEGEQRRAQEYRGRFGRDLGNGAQ